MQHVMGRRHQMERGAAKLDLLRVLKQRGPSVHVSHRMTQILILIARQPTSQWQEQVIKATS